MSARSWVQFSAVFSFFLLTVACGAAATATIAPTPTVDIEAAIQAGIEQTKAAQPTPTVDIDATVEARIEQTIAAQPTPTPTMIPTPTLHPPPKPGCIQQGAGLASAEDVRSCCHNPVKVLSFAPAKHARFCVGEILSSKFRLMGRFYQKTDKERQMEEILDNPKLVPLTWCRRFL